MNFPDFPEMNAVEPCFVTHQEVRTYLQNYAKHFDLLKHVQVNETRLKNLHQFIERNIPVQHKGRIDPSGKYA